MDLLRLVYVEVAALPDFAEGLFADRAFFHVMERKLVEDTDRELSGKPKYIFMLAVSGCCCF